MIVVVAVKVASVPLAIEVDVRVITGGVIVVVAAVAKMSVCFLSERNRLTGSGYV